MPPTYVGFARSRNRSLSAALLYNPPAPSPPRSKNPSATRPSRKSRRPRGAMPRLSPISSAVAGFLASSEKTPSSTALRSAFDVKNPMPTCMIFPGSIQTASLIEMPAPHARAASLAGQPSDCSVRSMWWRAQRGNGIVDADAGLHADIQPRAPDRPTTAFAWIRARHDARISRIAQAADPDLTTRPEAIGVRRRRPAARRR